MTLLNSLVLLKRYKDFKGAGGSNGLRLDRMGLRQPRSARISEKNGYAKPDRERAGETKCLGFNRNYGTNCRTKGWSLP